LFQFAPPKSRLQTQVAVGRSLRLIFKDVKHSPRPHIVPVRAQNVRRRMENMRPNIGRAIGGGLVGTLAMTLMIYLVAPGMGVKMDIAGSLAGMLGTSWTVGLIMHLINGAVIFPVIYALVLFRVLKGGPAAKGTEWGVILWLVAQLVVMPMLGAGVFSSKMGGVMSVMASLIGHLAYGSLLGAVAGGASKVTARLSAARA
jgi:uncharacterized membrane protein YagU involved in acid resistance